MKKIDRDKRKNRDLQTKAAQAKGARSTQKLLLALVFLIVGYSLANAEAYYIDYALGDDGAAGKTTSTAWKHSPGDPLATGHARSASVGPGDHLRFRGGVAYRGSIRVPASGAPGRPIVFEGDQWGPGRALFDGSDPVIIVRPCPSAESCGGAENWKSLGLVDFNTPAGAEQVKLFDDTGPLYESQYPRVADRFFADDTAGYEEVAQSQAASAATGIIRSAKLARLAVQATGQVQLSLWVNGNQVVRRRVLRTEGDQLFFEPKGVGFYQDRPGRVALVNSSRLIDRTGDYAIIAEGRAVVWRRDASDLEVGNGRGAINLAGHSDVVIHGFVFQHYFGVKGIEGTQINNLGGVLSRLMITDNQFRNSALYTRGGVITLVNMTDVIVSHNTIVNIERGSGVRGGKLLSRVTISENVMDRLGSTGIILTSASDAKILQNIITRLKGIHGNGISLYLENRNVEVIGNRVTDSSRPLTFHGDGVPTPGDHHFLISGNTLVSSDPASAALTSWGRNTRDVVIRNNILIAPKTALILAAVDSHLVVEDNQTTGVMIKGGQPGDWVMRRNSEPSRQTVRALTAPAASAP